MENGIKHTGFSDEMIILSKEINRLFTNVSKDMLLVKDNSEAFNKEILKLKKILNSEVTSIKKEISILKNNISDIKVRLSEMDKNIKKASRKETPAPVSKKKTNIDELTNAIGDMGDKIKTIENKLKI